MDTRFFRMDTRFPRLLAFAVATMLVCGGSAHASENANVALPRRNPLRWRSTGCWSPTCLSRRRSCLRGPDVVRLGDPPPRAPRRDSGRFHAFTAWGQLYQCAGTSGARGDGVQLRRPADLGAARGVDHLAARPVTSELQGAAFAEDYDGPTVPAHYVATDSGTAVTAGRAPQLPLLAQLGPRESAPRAGRWGRRGGAGSAADATARSAGPAGSQRRRRSVAFAASPARRR